MRKAMRKVFSLILSPAQIEGQLINQLKSPRSVDAHTYSNCCTR